MNTFRFFFLVAFSVLLASSNVVIAQDNALSFNGSDEYSNSVDLSADSSTFTMEFWVFPGNTTTLHTQDSTSIIGTANSPEYVLFPNNLGNGDSQLGVAVGTNGVVVYAHGDSYLPALLTYEVSISGWNHIAIVSTNNTVSLYVNGQFAKTGETSAQTLSPATQLGGGVFGYYAGYINEFRIWDTDRSQTEISTNMNVELQGNENGLIAYYPMNAESGTTVEDQTSNNYDLTLVNTDNTNWVPFNLAGSAIVFDGADDYMELNTDFLNADEPVNALTVEAWINIDNYPSVIHTVFDKLDGLFGFRFGIRQTGLIEMVIGDPTNSQFHIATSTVGIEPGNWYHIAATYDANTIRVYLNGELVGSDLVGAITIVNNTKELIIGGFGPYYMDGMLDELRIWNVVKTQSELLNGATQKLNGTESNLILYYDFDTINPGTTVLNNSNLNQDYYANNYTPSLSNLVLNPSDALKFEYPPEFENNTPELVSIIEGGFSVNLDLDTTSTVYYVVLDDGASEPTGNEIKAGTGSGGAMAVASGSITINQANYIDTLRVENLNSGIYDIYLVAEHFENGKIQYKGTKIDVVAGAGNAIHLDPTQADRIFVPQYKNYAADTAITVEAWVNPDNITSAGLIVDASAGGSSIGFNIYRNLDRFGFNIGTGQVNSLFSNELITIENWYHVAGVYDGQAMRLYVNGILQDTLAVSGNILNSNSNLGIGIFGASPTNLFDGIIDEVRVWGIARTEEEINSTMRKQLSGDETGLILYNQFDVIEDNAFYNSTTTIENKASATGSALDGYFLDYASGSPSTPARRSPEVVVSTSFDTDLSGPDVENGTPFLTNITDSSYTLSIDYDKQALISYVVFPQDSTPPKNHEIINCAKNDCNLIQSDTLSTSTGDHTATLTINRPSVSEGYDVYMVGLGLYEQKEATKFEFRPAQIATFFDGDALKITSKNSQSFGLSFDVSEPSVVSYLLQYEWQTAPTKQEVLNGTGAGGSNPVAFGTHNTNGILDTLTVSSNVTNQAYTLYIVASDTTTNEHSALKIVSVKPPYFAIDFDGANDYTTTTHITDLPSTFTIEFWANPANATTLHTQSNTGTDGVKNAPEYAVFPTNLGHGNSELGIAVGTNGVVAYAHGDFYAAPLLSKAVSLSGWNHIAVVSVDDSVSLYINGQLSQEGETSALTLYPANQIGGGAAGYYHGSLDEFRIWSFAKTSAQIQQTMTSALTGKEDSLKMYYDFDQVMNNAIQDLSGNSFHGVLANFNSAEILIQSGAMGDSFAPYFETGPSATDIYSAKFTINADLSEKGTVYYVVMPDGSGAPNSAEVKAGTGASGAVPVAFGSSQTTSDTHIAIISVSGLSPSTSYDVYVVAEDDETSPNLQSSPVSLDISTITNSAPVASNQRITARDLALNEQIKATFTFTDVDGDSSKTPHIVWYRSIDAAGTNKVIISGVSDSVYTINPMDLGKWISAEMAPFDGEFYGDTTETSPIGPVIPRPRFGERALLLDGSGDYVSLGSGINLANQSFTISFWSRKSTNTSTGYIFGLADSLDDYQSMYLGYPDGLDVFRFGFYNDELNTGSLTNNTEWTFWAVTFDASTKDRKIYQNGTLLVSDQAGANFQGSGNLDLGRWNSSYFNGIVDELTIWSQVRTDSEIRRDMFKQLKGDESGLLGYWPVKDGLKSATLSDYSSNGHDGSLMGDTEISNIRVRPQGSFLTGNAGWRLLTAPIDSLSYGQFLKDLWTQGYPGASTTSGSSNVYWYDEATRTWNAPNDSSNVVGTGSDEGSSIGKGILVYVFDIGGWPKRITTSGKYSVNNFNLDLTETEIENDTQEGWHVVGNPYPFSIKWTDLVSRSRLTGISPVIFIYDPSANSGAGSYRVNYGYDIPNLPGSVAHDGVLEPFQAFWVRTTGSDSTRNIGFNSTDITGEGGTLYGKEMKGADDPSSIENYLLLTIEQDGNSEASVIRFSEEEPFEISKPFSLSDEEIEFGFSNTEGEIIAFENAEYIADTNIERFIHFESSVAGEVRFSVSGFQSWSENIRVILTDLEDGEEYSITDEAPITFYANSSVNKSRADEEDPLSIISNSGTAKQKTDFAPRFRVQFLLGNAVSNEQETDLPEVVSLSQNYPNPFNPTTNIEFGLPSNSDVIINIYNVLGQQVMTLVDSKMEAGYHSVVFNGQSLASGVYFYRMTIDGEQSILKKMMLIK